MVLVGKRMEAASIEPRDAAAIGGYPKLARASVQCRHHHIAAQSVVGGKHLHGAIPEMNQSGPVGADPQTAIPIGKEYPALHIRFQGFERVTANAKDPAVHGDPDIPVLVLVCFKGG